MLKKRIIAYHLPQFHPIKENDQWWGPGYTEWTAMKRWKPYFKGHELRRPERLGYYNLLEPGIINKQFEIADQYGIEGFCFWTYWFGNGERLLEKPLEQLLRPENKVRYCIAWANHDWFDKSKWRLLKKQSYLGRDDYEKFFFEMLPHFKNPRYIKKDNRLVVSIFMPNDCPDLNVFCNTWNELSIKEGFGGIYFVSDQYQKDFKFNDCFSAFCHSPAMFSNRNIFQRIIERLVRYHNWTFLGPMRYSFPRLMRGIYKNLSKNDKFIPTIFSGWDTTPRHASRGVVLKDFNEKTFADHVSEVFSLGTKEDFIFIKSWNEWAEGNVLEPDNIFRDKILEVIKKANKI